MNYLATVFIVALVAAASVQSTNSFARAQADHSMINYLMQSSASLLNPELSTECFGKYLPILSDVAKTFSVQYQACINEGTTQTANLTTKAAQSRASFVQDTDSICSAYTSCAQETDVYNFFNCYASVSSKDVGLVYNISNNASYAASSYMQNLQLIQENTERCTNATESTYVSDTAATYRLLDACLEYGLPADQSTSTVKPDDTTTVSTATPVETTTTTENIVFVDTPREPMAHMQPLQPYRPMFVN